VLNVNAGRPKLLQQAGVRLVAQRATVCAGDRD
jgi:hypothetical protein